jgi:hypothetical protein
VSLQGKLVLSRVVLSLSESPSLFELVTSTVFWAMYGLVDVYSMLLFVH